MQGAWVVVDLVDDGTSVPKDVLSMMSVKFAGDKFTIVMPDESHEVVFKLDPSSNPKRMDATPSDGPNKGKTIFGIYELQADGLKVCLPNRAGIKRPTELLSKKGSEVGLLILKRPSK
jgi:uncharacterized protein (TIGR03067 family)